KVGVPVAAGGEDVGVEVGSKGAVEARRMPLPRWGARAGKGVHMRVLFIGGTGNISAAAARLAVWRGGELGVLDRGLGGGSGRGGEVGVRGRGRCGRILPIRRRWRRRWRGWRERGTRW